MMLAIQQRMQWYVDQEILPCCATLIMKDLEVIDYQTMGYMDLESKEPLRKDAIYRIYSNTKIITSAMAMVLWEEGHFQLGDPISTYLPEFTDMRVLRADAKSGDDTEACAQPMTIRHLLSHSAGLSYGFVDPESVIDQAYMAAGINPMGPLDDTLEDLSRRLAELPLAYQPGGHWRYSFATDVIARLIEVVCHASFDEVLRERLFSRLGMVDTGFVVPEDKRHRFITMYAPADMFDPMKPGLTKADDPNTGLYTKPRNFLSGGGGLVSTVQDYLNFFTMLVSGGEHKGEQILQPASIQMMRTNQLPEGVGVSFPMWDMPGTVFGLGLALKQTPTADESAQAKDEFHWGGIGGTHTWFAPHAGLVGMCMTQLMPGFWHPFSHDFKRLAYDMENFPADTSAENSG